MKEQGSAPEETKRKGMAEMCGELSREGGLLVGVFGFLEGSLREVPPGPQWFFEVGLVSLVMMVVGVLLEKWRP